MASEREKAKGAIRERKPDDPGLAEKFNEAQTLQHKVALNQEEHRHKEEMRSKELGWVGRIVGGEATASLTVAFIVVCFGLVTSAGCLAFAVYFPNTAEFWAKQSERSVALALAALSFIFGKSAGRSTR